MPRPKVARPSRRSVQFRTLFAPLLLLLPLLLACLAPRAAALQSSALAGTASATASDASPLLPLSLPAPFEAESAEATSSCNGPKNKTSTTNCTAAVNPSASPSSSGGATIAGEVGKGSAGSLPAGGAPTSSTETEAVAYTLSGEIVQLESAGFVSSNGALNTSAIEAALLAAIDPSSGAHLALSSFTVTAGVVAERFTREAGTSIGFSPPDASAAVAAALASHLSLPLSSINVSSAEFTRTDFEMTVSVSVGGDHAAVAAAVAALAHADASSAAAHALAPLLCGASDCVEAWVRVAPPSVTVLATKATKAAAAASAAASASSSSTKPDALSSTPSPPLAGWEYYVNASAVLTFNPSPFAGAGGSPQESLVADAFEASLAAVLRVAPSSVFVTSVSVASATSTISALIASPTNASAWALSSAFDELLNDGRNPLGVELQLVSPSLFGSVTGVAAASPSPYRVVRVPLGVASLPPIGDAIEAAAGAAGAPPAPARSLSATLTLHSSKPFPAGGALEASLPALQRVLTTVLGAALTSVDPPASVAVALSTPPTPAPNDASFDIAFSGLDDQSVAVIDAALFDVMGDPSLLVSLVNGAGAPAFGSVDAAAVIQTVSPAPMPPPAMVNFTAVVVVFGYDTTTFGAPEAGFFDAAVADEIAVVAPSAVAITAVEPYNLLSPAAGGAAGGGGGGGLGRRKLLAPAAANNGAGVSPTATDGAGAYSAVAVTFIALVPSSYDWTKFHLTLGQLKAAGLSRSNIEPLVLTSSSNGIVNTAPAGTPPSPPSTAPASSSSGFDGSSAVAAAASATIGCAALLLLCGAAYVYTWRRRASSRLAIRNAKVSPKITTEAIGADYSAPFAVQPSKDGFIHSPSPQDAPDGRGFFEIGLLPEEYSAPGDGADGRSASRGRSLSRAAVFSGNLSPLSPSSLVSSPSRGMRSPAASRNGGGGGGGGAAVSSAPARAARGRGGLASPPHAGGGGGGGGGWAPHATSPDRAAAAAAAARLWRGA